ncbi:hypothetical protein P2D89_24235 [Agrobacterium rhizogenes]|nr:hypothetical protein [Rhizobium rhizogenes]MDF1892113.1 hypothetical protein [Rhizobium rhizogenes]
MDEAVIPIGGKILALARRNSRAARRFFSRLVRQLGQPRVV